LLKALYDEFYARRPAQSVPVGHVGEIRRSLSNRPLTVGIVGAGPAGLSAARLLEETGRARAIVFEKEERVGGKSFSTPRYGSIHDIGTCYSTIAHAATNRWMRELRIPQRPIDRQMIDGVPVIRYILGDRPLTTASEALRFFKV